MREGFFAFYRVTARTPYPSSLRDATFPSRGRLMPLTAGRKQLFLPCGKVFFGVFLQIHQITFVLFLTNNKMP